MLVTRRRKRKRNSKSTKQRSTNISTAEDGRAVPNGVEEDSVLFTTNSFTLNCESTLELEQNELEEIDVVAESPPTLEERAEVNIQEVASNEGHSSVDNMDSTMDENTEELMRGLCPEDLVDFSFSTHNNTSLTADCGVDLLGRLQTPSLCSTPLGGRSKETVPTVERTTPVTAVPTECHPSPGFVLASSLYSQEIDNQEGYGQQGKYPASTMPINDSTSEGTFFGLPMRVKELFESLRGIKSLYEWQEQCLRLPELLNGRNLLYSLPTSGGKTLVAEILLLQEILLKKKDVLFVLPFVSIVQEKVRQLLDFAEALGFAVDEYASSKGRIPPRARRRRNTLFIATIEKSNGLVNSLIECGKMDSVGLVIIDELHMLGEEGRGAILEACLVKIRFSSPHTHIIGMSATLSNPHHLGSFLDAAVFTDSFRPVDLVEYCKVDGALYQVVYREDGTVNMCPFRVVPRNKELKEVDKDQLLPLILEVIPKEACLVFCASKRNCQNVALLLATHMPRSFEEHRREEKAALMTTLKLEASGLCPVLAKTLPFGVAYHHSGLSTEERRLVEEAYLEGTISVITCTSTLAAGVNLPAKRVIIRSPYIGSQFISKSQYKQMAGRAGRAGFTSTGESILIVPPLDRKKVMSMLTSGMDHCASRLLGANKRALTSLILESIALKLVKNRSSLLEMINQTLLSVQLSHNDIHREVLHNLEILISRGYIKSKLDKSVSELCLEVTRLGWATYKGTLDIAVAHHVFASMQEAQRCLVLSSELHLLYLATPPDLVHNIQPNWMVYLDMFARLSPEEQKISELIGVRESVLSRNATGTGKKLSPDMTLVYHKFFLSIMLRSLLRVEGSRGVWTVSEQFQCSRGFLQTLLQSSSSFASCLVHFTKELPELWAVHLLLPTLVKRLTFAVSIDMVPLLEIPEMKQGRARQLYAAGYKTPQDLAQATVKELVDNIDNLFPKAAKKIVKNAKALLAEQLEDLEEEIEKLKILSPSTHTVPGYPFSTTTDP